GVNRQDLGMALGRVRRRRMDRQLTEEAPERLVLLVRQLLVAEEHDQILHQRVVHFLELLIAERSRQVDPGDLGADMRRQLFDLDRLIRHRCAPAGFEIPDDSTRVGWVHWLDKQDSLDYVTCNAWR